MKSIVKNRLYQNQEFLCSLDRSKANAGHYRQVLDTIHQQFQAMLSHHSRVLMIRFDLHLHDWTDTNEPISRLFKKLHKRLPNTFEQKRFGYVWCREHNGAPAQHYHCGLLLNGNKVRHPQKVYDMIDYHWESWGNPLPSKPKNGYLMVARGDELAYARAFKRLSYFAKVSTKGSRPATTADYGASRLKPATEVKA